MLELLVRPFMVLIGANGVGKTSFLDALTLLSASAAGRLSETLSRFGGVAKLLTRGKCEEIALAVEMEVPGYETLRYRLQMEPKGAGFSITQETLTQETLSQQNSNHPRPFFYIDAHHGRVEYYNTETKRLDAPDWDYDPGETALSQVPKMFRQPEALRRQGHTAEQRFIDRNRAVPRAQSLRQYASASVRRSGHPVEGKRRSRHRLRFFRPFSLFGAINAESKR